MAKRQQNPWALGDFNIEEAQGLLQAGQMALDAGIVSPEKAAENLSPVLKAIGIDENPLLPGRRRRSPRSRVSAQNLTARPVGKDSGLYNEQMGKAREEEEDKTGFKSTAQHLLTMDPAQLQDLYSSFEQTPAFQEQLRGVEDLEDLLAMEARAPVDYITGPLAGLLQAEFGKDARGFLQGRTAPTPTEQRQRLLEGLSKLQGSRRDISKTILDAIGKQKAGTLTEMLYQDTIRKQLEEAAGKEGAKDPARNLGAGTMPIQSRALRDVQDKFNKSIEPFNKALNYAGQAHALASNVGPGKKLAKKTLETILARARGEVGNLSHYEQAGTVSAQAAFDRLDQFVETLSSGELSESNRREVMGLIKNYKDAARANINALRDVHTIQGVAAYGNIGLSESAIKQALPAVDTKPPKMPKREAGGYDGSGPLPKNATEEQKRLRLEHLRSKGGR